MIYVWLKILHVVSASILFGTSMGTAFYMFYVNLQNNISLIVKATYAVVIANWLFTMTSGVVQVMTGFSMIYLKGYSFKSLWIIGSIIGYFIAIICWLPIVWLQMRCYDLALESFSSNRPLSALYRRYFKIECLLGIPACVALVCVFYLMINKPGL
ncbi:MAG: DUF2269 domain-containing protein [Gammaproteobacteria bacterium]|nr:DUF2269 domain-containing protein [Gammaproteobacteria bacterium]